MNSRRVVITGFGLLSPLGNTFESNMKALREGVSGVRAMPDWNLKDLRPRIGAPVVTVDEKRLPREHRRSMGRLSILAALASDDAVAMARLSPDFLRSGRVGASVGQTVGSPSATLGFLDTLTKEGVRAVKSTAFFQVMSHSAMANVALHHGLRGPVFSPSAACASGSQALGVAFQSIQRGDADVMLAGGTEELHESTAATFDVVGGASQKFNDTPHLTPRPFDVSRDGLVVGEGAGIVVLEEMGHAISRGAKVFGEMLGFATTCDGEHMSTPSPRGMAETMALALRDAKLKVGDIDYVNAHATATEAGDCIEAQATGELFGNNVPVSSTKGHTGHTLAACGALEAIYCLGMLEGGFIAPTLHLRDIDPRCAAVRHVKEVEARSLRRVMSNNFAFGGVNTSLILSAPQ